jgi:hypothetical protein
MEDKKVGEKVYIFAAYMVPVSFFYETGLKGKPV